MSLKLCVLLISTFIFTQTIRSKGSSGWISSPFASKVFIENKGQFDEKANTEEKIVYGVNNLGTQIYYSRKGHTYRLDQYAVDSKVAEEFFKEEQKEKGSRTTKKEAEVKHEAETRKKMYVATSTFINLEWVDANPNAKIIASEPVQEYFNYNMGSQKHIYEAKAYQRITYKNLYPQVDLTYEFHEKGGMKYSLTLRPGADLSKIKMRYSGGEGINIDKEGHIHIKTPLGDIIDHAPICFYEGSNHEISSSFETADHTISFKVNDYDKTKTFIIDPWTTNPVFDSLNKAFEIESDALGNVYVYGSNHPIKLRKYNSLGNPMWTYNGWDTPGWFGDLTVDASGNSYISTGNPGDTTNIEKIDGAGIVLWSLPSMDIEEPFVLRLNTTGDTLYAAGGFGGSVGIINISTGICEGTAGWSLGAEIRGLTVAPNKKIYAITCNPLWTPGGRSSFLCGLTPDLTPLYVTVSCFGQVGANSFQYESPFYKDNTGWGITGQNSIFSDGCEYIYTYDGGKLCQNKINNGGTIKSITVNNGIISQNSGVFLDTCGGVYVGTQTGINKYDKDLNFISSINTPGSVYGICMGANNELLACGDAFVGAFADIVTCNNTPLSISLSSTPSDSANGTATVVVTGGDPPYNYVWSNGAITDTVTDLPPGIYSVTVTDSKPCNTLVTSGEIKVKFNNSGIEVPNIFTPNGDGKNEYFILKEIEQYPENKLIIYNRWGEKIEEFKDYKNTWTAENIPDGTYYYALDLFNDQEPQTGFITIKR